MTDRGTGSEKEEEEVWESADCSAANYTPHSSQRIEFFTTKTPTSVEISSVDTSTMSLLDVCNYQVEDQDVDGSGHCVWMGALYLGHALALGLELASSSSSTAGDTTKPWYRDEYFHNNAVAEMGCGTGAAGIALLKILLGHQQQESTTPSSMAFLDNDPEALELCRKNCQQNGISESLYEIRLQQLWADLSSSCNAASVEEEDFCFDTILATDVLYDLKIIRPFLQTARRFLQKSANNHKKKHLILSHVPRWFLPRDEDQDDQNYNAARALEDHIVQEAARFGFRSIQKVRPKEVVGYYETLTKEGGHQQVPDLPDTLQEMEAASAVLLILELT